MGGPSLKYKRWTRQEIDVNYTHYDYLEIPPCADDVRIETAYLRLVERLQYGSTDAGQDLSGLVRRIHAAYDVLSQPDARQAYDAALEHEAAQADSELKSMLDGGAPTVHRRVQDVPAELVRTVAQMAA
jgi:curved DNA-binding protein CbpA